MEARGVRYGDVSLTHRDIQLFADGRWLNDNCLSFYIEYLSRSIPSSKYLFVEPGTAFLIAMEDDAEDLRAGLHRLDLNTPEYILLPINDNTNPETEAGGSHWTLLVISKKTWTAYHINSLGRGGSNVRQAQLITTRLSAIIGGPRITSMKEVTVRPGQVNGYDCGVYVLTIGERIVSDIVMGMQENECLPVMYTKVAPGEVTEKRRAVEILLEELCRSNQSK